MDRDNVFIYSLIILFSLCFTILEVGGVGVQQQSLLLSEKVKGEGNPLAPIQSLAMPNMQEFSVPLGSGPHDVAPANDGKTVWYTAQQSGKLGRLDPTTGKTRQISLGYGSAPHGVIVGPDGAPWITDGGLNAIVRVDPSTQEVRTFPLARANANLNTAAFDR